LKVEVQYYHDKWEKSFFRKFFGNICSITGNSSTTIIPDEFKDFIWFVVNIMMMETT